MGKIIKAGKIVIVLNGRFAGKKAVVIKSFDDGSKDRKFGHALIAGIERYPRKVTNPSKINAKANAGASKTAKLNKRMRIKPFVKYVNFNHIMPTRYSIDVADALKTVVTEDALVSSENTRPEAKTTLLKTVKASFEARYKAIGEEKKKGEFEKATAGALYFFRKLKF